MKVLLSLTAICITLGFCHGACYRKMHEMKHVDGKWVFSDECIDTYDGTEHPVGSTWNSAHCLECSCGESGMTCCTRYGGIAAWEGCKAIVNPETCEYNFYKNDDLTKPC